jgi:hypothetical protein
MASSRRPAVTEATLEALRKLRDLQEKLGAKRPGKEKAREDHA